MRFLQRKKKQRNTPHAHGIRLTIRNAGPENISLFARALRLYTGLMRSRSTEAASGAVATAVAGCIALSVAMGIGRFAFTPVLPLMQDDYAMRVSDAGWLAASNYVGYLAGSLAAGALHLAPSVAIRTGLISIAALTAAMAAS